MTYWAELVELYEYRVADVLAGRMPRGGRRSLSELRDTLLHAPLEPTLYRRLVESDRQYRAGALPGRGERTTAAAAGPVPAWTAPASADSPEARAWEELRCLAWHAGLRERVQERMRPLRAEPGRLSLRVLYAALENAERDARGEAGPLAVPAENDPLVALHDAEVVRQLGRGLADVLLTEEGRARLGAALWSVHDAPFPRHPDEDVLGARVRAAESEPLAPEARGALVRALRASYPPTRDPRERPAIREAARHLQALVAELLSAAPVPASLGVMPAHSVLYAAHGPAALSTPDDRAGELVIHLAGGQQARWRGLTLRWHAVGPSWQLQVGEPGEAQVALLHPHLPPAERAWTLPTPQGPLSAFLSGAYLRLHLPHAAPAPGEGPGHLAARARAVARLLDPAASHAQLRLARAAAQHLRGAEVDAAALGPASAERYAGASPETLHTLARKGVDALTARLSRLPAAEAEAALRACAARLGLPDEQARSLHAVLHAATFTPEGLPAPHPSTRLNVPDGGQFVSLRLGDGPVTLHAAGRALTLHREDGGDLSVLLPDQPPALLRDLLVLTLPGAQVLVVREGSWLAAAVQPATI
ncbi:hypothetical protein V3W47_09715 [Deinococcus sp. YIM 134068]|uniref:hypothetical protein n=1 Tax=Deinococcus lichenicola TaxID=3118910 RepID=UPI002F943798